MKKSLTKFGIFFVVIIILGTAGIANAATLNINTNKDTYQVNDQFNADVKLDSQDVGVNAAQATIKFSPAVLQVVSVEKTSSVFNFWIQDPTFDNNTGEITFVGGSASGLTGQSLQLIRIVFKATGLGQSDLIFTDGAVTASDGSGTNVLTAMNKAPLTIANEAAAANAGATKIQTIERTAIAANTAPAKPVLNVPLYPNPANWYNISSKFTASWQLPADVSAVATDLNKDPAFVPSKSQGVFNNQTFSALSDGIWYLHVRFYNNMGWSVTNHYRIAVDTVPPPPFAINLSDGPSSNNPTPTISYKAVDQLNLINYFIQIDKNERVSTTSNKYILPPQKPGKHTVRVSAQDAAGNRVENSADFEILPIASPTIASVTTTIISGEGGLVINGTSISKGSMLLDLKDNSGNIIYSFKTNSDEFGKWAMKIDSPLKNGSYYIEATAQDDRGAMSLPIKSATISVSAKPIIQIGFIKIGTGGTIVFLILVLLLGFGSGAIFYTSRQRRLAMRVQFAESELEKIFKIIKEDVEALYKAFATETTGDDEYAIKTLRDNLSKMETYFKKGIEKINK